MDGGPGLPAAAAFPALGDFRQALGTVFQIQVDDRSVEATLVEVDETARRSGWETFSLIFTGADVAFPQAMHPVRHHQFGSFPLFLVPIAGDGGGQRYEAVFNRPAS